MPLTSASIPPADAGAYRGRLAPSPTGYLHLGHARTFWRAQERAQSAQGTLVLRDEDLDRARCRPEFVDAMFDDLRWFGFQWQEGPDLGGPFAPYAQSERMEVYRAAFERLKSSGAIYPCTCSRQDVLRALTAPHAGEDEPIYPGTCRPGAGYKLQLEGCKLGKAPAKSPSVNPQDAASINWRFFVPDGEI